MPLKRWHWRAVCSILVMARIGQRGLYAEIRWADLMTEKSSWNRCISIISLYPYNLLQNFLNLLFFFFIKNVQYSQYDWKKQHSSVFYEKMILQQFWHPSTYTIVKWIFWYQLSIFITHTVESSWFVGDQCSCLTIICLMLLKISCYTTKLTMSPWSRKIFATHEHWPPQIKLIPQ